MEQQKVSFIQLRLQNLEAITINAKHVISLDLDNISEDHHIIWVRSDKSVEKRKHCEYMQLVISLGANIDITSLASKTPMKVFDRLSNWSDIVEIAYLDSRLTELESINLPWRDKNEEGTENEYQRDAIDNNGNLVIFIEKPSTNMSEEDINNMIYDIIRTKFYWVELEEHGVK